MINKELEKLGFKSIRVGKNYYTFIIAQVPVMRKKRVCYGVYPMNIETGKSYNIVEYIDLMDAVKNRVQAINKVKRNLIKKLKKIK